MVLTVQYTQPLTSLLAQDSTGSYSFSNSLHATKKRKGEELAHPLIKMADEEKVILEVPGVRHKKQDGILLLTSLRIAWAPGEILQTFQVDYPYQQIKSK